LVGLGTPARLAMSERLLVLFPSLRITPYRITSPVNCNYNCVAWAAGSSSEWWWPLEEGVDRVHWPLTAPRESTLDAFREAFASLCFELCSNDGLEAGFEKVAIFIDPSGVPS